MTSNSDVSDGEIIAMMENAITAFVMPSTSGVMVNQLSLEIESVKSHKQTSISLVHNPRMVTILLRVLDILHELKIENKRCSKRDIFYRDPALFKKQSVSDDAISTWARTFGVSRLQLNVLAAAKGLVIGPVSFTLASETLDCSTAVTMIPANSEEITNIQIAADAVFVIEKECIFRGLIEAEFPRKLFGGRVILITGCGYPDISTRAFLHHLSRLQLPIHGICDGDPYGLEIMCVYKFGSDSLAHQAQTLVCENLVWMGLRPSDFSKFPIQQQSKLPLKEIDKSKARALINRAYLQHQHADWINEMQLLLTIGYKLELESLMQISSNYLVDLFIATKLRTT